MDNNNQNQEGQQLQIDLSPEIAKGVYTNFQIALQDNVVRYEKEFGKIDRHEPEQEPRTIAPFGPGKVDA